SGSWESLILRDAFVPACLQQRVAALASPLSLPGPAVLANPAGDESIERPLPTPLAGRGQKQQRQAQGPYSERTSAKSASSSPIISAAAPSRFPADLRSLPRRLNAG